MNTYKIYYPSTMFSGEIILNDEKGYDTEAEAKANCNDVYPDVDWEEFNEKGFLVGASYGIGNACPWI